MRKTATVLGGGIQGACVALMLERRGCDVVLVDKVPELIRRASLTFEGKIHLGFVYGMDRTLRTGLRMVNDALHFGPVLEELLATRLPWARLRSRRNVYGLVRDSMLSTDEVEQYFGALDAEFRERLAGSDLHYLGERPDRACRRIAVPSWLAAERIEAAFHTEEVSVDQLELRRLVVAAVGARPRIARVLGHAVETVEPVAAGFVASLRAGDGTRRRIESEIVVNCLWEGRVRVDRQVGIPADADCSLRLKYGLYLALNDSLRALDSLTLIHGPYGNLVVSPAAGSAFCSWYPASLKGLIPYGPLPPAWEQACAGRVSPALARELGEANHAGLREFVPDLAPFEVLQVTAGVIVAEGLRDISERDSGFHSRAQPPVVSRDGYYSVNTGKYTSAPRNTRLLEQAIFG